MHTRIYRRILKDTTKNYYDYVLKYFFKYLQEENIIKYHKRHKRVGDAIDISLVADKTEQINKVFEGSTKIYKKCEEFEYEKPYRYCYLYKIKSINYEGIKEYIEKNKAKLFVNDFKTQDSVNEHMIMAMPTIKEHENKIYIKFSIKLDNKVNGKTSIKHIVLAVIHKEYNLLEVRQDAIPMKFNPSSDFYENNTRSAVGFIGVMLNAQTDPLDIESIIRYMKKNKQDEVNITSVKYKKNGATALLNGSGNENFQLPIIDELKGILSENIFNIENEHVNKIKDRLKRFINEIEELSGLPAATILWKKEKYQVDVFDAEEAEELSYLKWDGQLKGRESIEYVTEYIMQCERAIDEEYESE